MKNTPIIGAPIIGSSSGAGGGSGPAPEDTSKLDKSNLRVDPFPIVITGYQNTIAGADADLQGWTTNLGAVLFDATIGENIYQLFDSSGSIASNMEQALSALTWDNIYAFGTTFNVETLIPTDSADGDPHNYWFGFDASTNPGYTQPGSDEWGGWRFTIKRDAGNQVLNIPTGAGAGDYTLPEGYNRIAMVPQAGVGATTWNLILNGAFLAVVDIYFHVNNYAANKIIMGSGTGGGTGNKLNLKALQFITNYSDNVRVLTSVDFRDETIIITPPGLRHYTIELPLFSDLSLFGGQIQLIAKNTGDVTVQRQAGDTFTTIEGLVEAVYSSTNDAKEITIAQFSYDVNGSAEAGFQFFDLAPDSTVFLGEDASLVQFDAETGRYVEAEQGATISGSQAITQEVPRITYGANSGTGSFSVGVAPTGLNFYALADDGETLTLDFGDPSLLPTDETRQQTFLVDPINGSVVFTLDGANWFGHGSDTVTITEKSTITVWMVNGISGAGGNLAIVPTIHFGSDYQDVVDDSSSLTSSSTYQTKIILTTPVIPAGRYRIGYSAELTSTTNAKFGFRIDLDSGTIIGDADQKPGGNGEWDMQGGFSAVDLTAGVHTVDMQYNRPDTGDVMIRYARLELWRVS